MCQDPGVSGTDRAIAWDGSEERDEAVPEGSAGAWSPAGGGTLWTRGEVWDDPGIWPEPPGGQVSPWGLSSGGRGSGQDGYLDSPLQVPSCPDLLVSPIPLARKSPASRGPVASASGGFVVQLAKLPQIREGRERAAPTPAPPSRASLASGSSLLTPEVSRLPFPEGCW